MPRIKNQAREEWKLKRAEFRAIRKAMSKIPHDKDKAASNAWDTLWTTHIFNSEFYKQLPEWKSSVHFGVKSHAKMKCNMDLLPNSFPHRTRNP